MELTKMTVRPDARRQGIGRTMLTRALDRVRAAGAGSLVLGSSTRRRPAGRDRYSDRGWESAMASRRTAGRGSARRSAEGTAPPRIRAVDLPDLHDADVGIVAGDATASGLRFRDLDLTGRSLPGLSVTECEITTGRFSDADLAGCRLVAVEMSGVDATVLRATGATWREVAVRASRIGAAELYDSVLDNVAFAGCRLGFVNLRGASLTDVVFDGCTVDELDLGDAELTRVAFRATAVRSLVLRGARLADVDLRGADLAALEGVESLRGATVTAAQVLELAPVFAAAAGLRVDE